MLMSVIVETILRLQVCSSQTQTALWLVQTTLQKSAELVAVSRCMPKMERVFMPLQSHPLCHPPKPLLLQQRVQQSVEAVLHQPHHQLLLVHTWDATVMMSILEL
jgi:hypothetical protein